MSDIPIVVLGSGGVGKSCLTIQYVQGHFVDQYDATIEDVYRKPINVDAQPAVLTVVDTAGQETFGAMRDQYLRKGKGFVLVYSITDLESFLQVQKIYNQLRTVRGATKAPVCVLVGNKIDQETYRAVDREKGRHLAAELMRCPFLEVTAKDHAMATDVFETLVRSIRGGNEGGGVNASAGTATAGPASPLATGPAGQASASNGLEAGRDGPGVTPTVSTPASPTGITPSPSSERKKKKRCTLL